MFSVLQIGCKIETGTVGWGWGWTRGAGQPVASQLADDDDPLEARIISDSLTVKEEFKIPTNWFAKSKNER